MRLLGHPEVAVDGEVVTPPRGVKAWGLLAYLAASERARSRSELAGLLFGAAEDPLGALRWNLAALRRLLGLPDALKGDWLRLDLPEGVTVDTRLLSSGDLTALGQDRLGDQLLAGLTFADCPVFETWLIAERQRHMRRATSLIREAALTSIAQGDIDSAVRHASELVSRDPFDEGHHALIIRAHAAAGDAVAARRQFEACRLLLSSELGTEPGPAVVAALRAADALDRRPRNPAPSAEEVQARLAIAWQSFLSGTVDHAIDVMRGAVAMADAGHDEILQAMTRIFLGAMLSMAVRGWDEAATALSEAHHISLRADRSADAATALGVRAGTEMMRGDYSSGPRCAQVGLALSDDSGARSLNLTFLAAIEGDLGDLDKAADHARSATSAAASSGDPIRILYAAAHTARIHLMRGETAAARAEIKTASPPAKTSILSSHGSWSCSPRSRWRKDT